MKQYSEVDAAYVKEHMEDAVIVDVRTLGEYLDGHIPGALNLPYDMNLSLEQNAADLSAMLEAADIDPEEPLIIYCRSGVRAAKAAEALSLTPYKNLSVYPGSWLDWSSDPANPVEH